MKKFVLILAAVLSTAGLAAACEVCGTYVALADREAVGRPSVSVFEQYNKYDAPRSGGHELESWNTQVSGQYRFNPRWSVQAGVPYIDRELDGETEAGIGDATLFGVYRVVDVKSGTSTILADAYAGLKLPTGNTDPLKEEREVALENQEHEEHGDEGGHIAHAHGHHISLGSGSWDGIFGATALLKSGRWMGLANAQYRLTTEGDYEYEYGDECSALLGARYFAVLADEQSLAVGFDLTGDWRDENEVLGETQPDTDVSAAYLGPVLAYSRGESFRAWFAWDVAVDGENEGLHGAADKRWRANASWLF